MYALLAQLVRFLPATPSMHENPGVANQLMESADACVGNSPHHAQELREAACAYLSVVR
jgi:hypothetical protein